MASREHLIPTPTVDKNGKPTTVYVKPSIVAKVLRSVGVPVPSPSLPRGIDREKLAMDLAKKWHSESGNEDLRDALYETVKTYSDDLLERLTTVELEPYPELWISYSVGNAYPENEINEQIEFFPYIRKGTYYSTAKNLVQSLRGYPRHLNYEDFSKESEAVKEQYRALLLVTEAIYNGSYFDSFKDEKPTFILKDDSLVELVINNSDKAEVMVDFIRERSTGDAGPLDVSLLADVIASESPSISGGLL